LRLRSGHHGLGAGSPSRRASSASGLNDSVPFRVFLSEVVRSRSAELDLRFVTAWVRVPERLLPAEAEVEAERYLPAVPRCRPVRGSEPQAPVRLLRASGCRRERPDREQLRVPEE
jgi:hypothetical protein